MAQINGGGGKYAGATTTTKASNLLIPSPLNLADTSGNTLGITAAKPFTPYNYPGVAALSSQSAPKAAAPAPSGGGGGGGLSTNAAGTVASVADTQQAPPAPQPMSNDAWWNQDAAFQTEQAGLGQTKQSALDALKNKRTSYDSDFITALRNMGYNWGGLKGSTLDGLAQGSFDPQNQLGAYGRGFQDLQNDYAGRGMLDSSFYDTANRNFNTDYQNQFANMGTQRANYNADLSTQEQAALNEYQNALERARQSSLARKTIAGV